MTTRRHVHAENLPAPPEAVFAVLHTPGAIRAWWGAARAIVMPEPGGIWAAAWGADEDEPDYITVATIRAFEPPRRLVLDDYRYRARTGPLPFEASFVTEFLVTPHPQGATLRVTQDGFPADTSADEFYRACAAGWRETFAGLRRFLATGGASGAPSSWWEPEAQAVVDASRRLDHEEDGHRRRRSTMRS